MSLIPEFIARLRSLCPDPQQTYALHEPHFGGSEWHHLKDCLDSGWVSSVGSYVDDFEARLAEYTGVKRAVAVVNGTAALQVCLRLAGVQQGEEVLLPTLTFVATANSVSYLGAVPHFVDSDSASLGIDPQRLREYLQQIGELRQGRLYNKQTGRRLAALMPMHSFGIPVDLDPLLELCARYSLPMIEDAAESLGSYYKGRHTGSFGLLSALSFNGNKIITTGGGGAILTNDEALGNSAKHLTTTARLPHAWRYWHDELGYNFRLPNLNAALGCAQLAQLPSFLESKRLLAERYQQLFADLPEVRLYQPAAWAKSNNWLNVLLLEPQYQQQRDQLLDACVAQKLMLRPAWVLLHKLPMYQACPRMQLTVAEELEGRILTLPSSVKITQGLKCTA
jgi:perosamine synthetase